MEKNIELGEKQEHADLCGIYTYKEVPGFLQGNVWILRGYRVNLSHTQCMRRWKWNPFNGFVCCNPSCNAKSLHLIIALGLGIMIDEWRELKLLKEFLIHEPICSGSQPRYRKFGWPVLSTFFPFSNSNITATHHQENPMNISDAKEHYENSFFAKSV